MPRFNHLAEWLHWQETLHPRAIDLGLDRVAAIADRLGLRQPRALTVTVAGTNGKGSSIAMLESILLQAGYRVCSYTSPHLLRYNERIRLGGTEVSNAALCHAFAAIDKHRGQDTLTYFEFGTLAALLVIQSEAPDIMLLEVGLGGRLDAVNIIDPDIALLTAIGIDHAYWLGNDRETIGREKAGIMRRNIPAISSDSKPLHSVRDSARTAGAVWYGLNEQFHYEINADDWCWTGPQSHYASLPFPALPGAHQFHNAAGVLMVLEAFRERLPVDTDAVVKGLQGTGLPGRCQFVPGNPETVLDVAHNPQSARCLAKTLRNRAVPGTTHMVLGMLEDKDIGQFTEHLAPVADYWCLAGLETARGLTSAALRSQLSHAIDPHRIACFPNVAAAMRYANQACDAGDRVVICGSFHTVAEAMGGVV